MVEIGRPGPQPAGYYDYKLETFGANFLIRECSGLPHHVETAADAAIHWCEANGPAEGTIVQLKAPFYCEPEVTINRSFFSIRTGLRSESISEISIKRIVIVSAAAEVRDVRLEGFHGYQLHFNCSGAGALRYVYVDQCRYTILSAYGSRGLIFEQTSTGSLNNIYFSNTVFSLSGQAADHGGFTFRDSIGDIHFTDCLFYISTTPNMALFRCNDDAQIGNVTVKPLNVDMAASAAGFVLVYVDEGVAANSRGPFGLKFIGGMIENAADATLVQVADSPAFTKRCKVLFDGVTFNPLPGATLNMINNACDNFTATGGPSFLAIEACTKIGDGTLAVGTPLEQPNFSLELEPIHGWSPIGILATPFDNTVGAEYIEVAGAAAGPTRANVDYVVRNTDIIFNSSGGADVNITIQDPASTIIETVGATATNKLVKRGFIVNFGDFSVAPTVQVWSV